MTKENLEEMIKGYRWAGVTYPPKQTVTEKLIAKKAMEMADAHAKEIAIGFDKWKSDEGYIKHPVVKYSYIHVDTNETIYSVTHLYNLYLQSLKQRI